MQYWKNKKTTTYLDTIDYLSLREEYEWDKWYIYLARQSKVIKFAVKNDIK